MRPAGPRRLSLGRNGRRALSLRRPRVHEVQPQAGPAPDAHLPALRDGRRPPLRRHRRRARAVPGAGVRRRRRQDARSVCRQPPGHRVRRGGDPVRRHGPRAVLRQGRSVRGGQGSGRRRRGRRRGRSRGRLGRALLRARRPSFPPGVRTRRRVRASSRSAVRGDDRRGAVRRQGAPLGPDGQASVPSAEGRPEVRARRRGPARIERGGPPRLRRPGRAARADRPGARLPAGWCLAPDREARGIVLRRRAVRARRPGGLALGRTARRRARPAARPRRVHELDPVGRAVAGGGLGHRPTEVGRGARTALGRDRAGPEPAGSDLGRSPPIRCRGRARRQHDRGARGGHGWQPVGRLLARRGFAVHAGRQAPAVHGRGRGARAVPGGGHPRARRRRSLVRGRRGAVSAARGFEGDGARARRARPREARQRARLRRRPRRDAVRREQAGNPAPDGAGPAQVHARRRTAARLPLVDRVRLRRQRGRGVPRVDRRRAGDHRGRPDHRKADRHFERAGLEQGRPARARCHRRALDRDRHRGRRVRQRLDAVRPLRQAGRDGQRGSRPECILRRGGWDRVARLEPRPDPFPGGRDAGPGAAAPGRDHRSARRRARARPRAARAAARERAQLQRVLGGTDVHRVAQGPLQAPDGRPGRPVHGDRADGGALPGPADRLVHVRGPVHFGVRQSLADSRRPSVSRSTRRGGRPGGRGHSGCCSRRPR